MFLVWEDFLLDRKAVGEEWGQAWDYATGAGRVADWKDNVAQAVQDRPQSA